MIGFGTTVTELLMSSYTHITPIIIVMPICNVDVRCKELTECLSWSFAFN